MAGRYCGNCGEELGTENRFCQNCGSAVRDTAYVPTPEADVSVPPIPQQQAGGPSDAQSSGPSEDPQAEGRKRNPLLVGCLVIVGILVLLTILGTCGGGGSGSGGDQEKEQAQKEEEQAQKEPKPAPPSAPEPISLSGTGQQVTEPFDLESGLVVFDMTHQKGQGNFALELLDESGEMVDLPANVIGPFDGSSALGVKESTYVLDVTADGSWSVTVKQPRPTDAPETRSFQGQSAAATEPFTLSGGLTRFEMSHSGEENFAVTVLDADGNMVALPANDIGNFEGSAAEQLPGGIYVLDVEADGPWTIEIQ